MCAVDLLWDLPSNFVEDDVLHFTVIVNDQNNGTETSRSYNYNYTMCVCEPHNVTITYTDRCGRTGSSTSVITLNTAQPLFECPLTTTTTSTIATSTTATSPDNECRRFDLKSE